MSHFTETKVRAVTWPDTIDEDVCEKCGKPVFPEGVFFIKTGLCPNCGVPPFEKANASKKIHMTLSVTTALAVAALVIICFA